jgi:hypothetical protein
LCCISSSGLDTDAIVDCILNSLLAPQIFLSSLDRNMSEQKLDLFEFAAGNMAEASARSAEIMGRQMRQAKLCCLVFNNMPDHSIRYEIAPGFSGSTNTSK